MSATVSDFLIERLTRWGIRRIFGFPGDGINGIMEALRTRQDRIRFIQVRHEGAAAFMASSTPSGPAGWACAWRPPAPAESISSTGFMTPSSMASPF